MSKNPLRHPAWPTEQGGASLRHSLYDNRHAFITNVSPFCAAAIYFGNVGVAPHDAALSRQALLKLSYVYRHFLQNAGLKTSVQRETAAFSGTVTNKVILTLAENLAREIEGITAVDVSEVTLLSPLLDGKGFHSPEDYEARACAKLLLATDHTLPASVELAAVQKKLAFLEGEVANPQQKSWAEQLVQGTGLEISSRISVTAKTPANVRTALLLDDESLQTLIKLRLSLTKETSDLTVKVRANRGMIYLTGKAKTETQRQRAENLARTTLGVRELRQGLVLI